MLVLFGVDEGGDAGCRYLCEESVRHKERPTSGSWEMPRSGYRGDSSMHLRDFPSRRIERIREAVHASRMWVGH